MQLLLDRQRDITLSALDLDPVAMEIERYFEDDELACLEGTATDILRTLTPEREWRPSNWPKSPSHFANQLSRITPALRQKGIDVERLPRTAKGRFTRITKQPVFDD